MGYPCTIRLRAVTTSSRNLATTPLKVAACAWYPSRISSGAMGATAAASRRNSSMAIPPWLGGWPGSAAPGPEDRGWWPPGGGGRGEVEVRSEGMSVSARAPPEEHDDRRARM
jgi:hypothetical protein